MSGLLRLPSNNYQETQGYRPDLDRYWFPATPTVLNLYRKYRRTKTGPCYQCRFLCAFTSAVGCMSDVNYYHRQRQCPAETVPTSGTTTWEHSSIFCTVNSVHQFFLGTTRLTDGATQLTMDLIGVSFSVHLARQLAVSATTLVSKYESRNVVLALNF